MAARKKKDVVLASTQTRFALVMPNPAKAPGNDPQAAIIGWLENNNYEYEIEASTGRVTVGLKAIADQFEFDWSN